MSDLLCGPISLRSQGALSGCCRLCLSIAWTWGVMCMQDKKQMAEWPQDKESVAFPFLMPPLLEIWPLSLLQQCSGFCHYFDFFF